MISSRTRLAQLTAMSGAGAAQLACNAGAAFIATMSLSPAERGLMVIGMTIGSVFGLVGGFGTGSAFRRLLCTAPADRDSLVSSYARCSATGAISAALLAVAGAAASAPLISEDLARPPLLWAVACFTAVQVVVQQAVDAWFADGRFRRGGVTATVTSAGGLIGVLLATTATPTAAMMLLAQAAGTAVVFVAEAVALRRHGLLRWASAAHRDVAALLRLGAPTLGLSIGLVVALRADRYVLGLSEGPAAVGVYSLAATLSEIPRMFPVAIGQLYLRDVALGRRTRSLTKATCAALATTAVGGLIGVTAASAFVVPLFGEAFSGAQDLLILLFVAEVCFAPFAVASRGLIGGGWTTAACVVGGVGAVSAAICYGIAAGLGGSVGVAVGSVIVYAALSVASWILLRRRLSRTQRRRGVTRS